MKKAIVLLSVVLAISGCTHKEGAPDSRKKLSTIYTSTSVTRDGEPYYTMGQSKAQQWMWDGKEVYRIDYTEDIATYSENIFYDKKHRIIRTTIPAKGLRSEFLYDGRKLQQIEVFKDDQLNYTLSFTHEKRKIATIEQVFSKGEPTDYMPLHLFLSEDAVDALRQSPGAKGQDAVYKLTWTGDNVTRIAGGGYDVTFAYDNHRNPLRDLYDLFEIEEDDVNIALLSENNPTRITRPFRGNPSYDFNYQYTYDNHYPTSRSVVYSYTSMHDTTFEDCLMTITETRTYQYL